MEEGESSLVPKEKGKSDRIKLKKLEIPVFNGTNPDDWLFWTELYFQLHKLTDEEKLTVAVVSFEGRANKWFRWADQSEEIQDMGGSQEEIV